MKLRLSKIFLFVMQPFLRQAYKEDNIILAGIKDNINNIEVSRLTHLQVTELANKDHRFGDMIDGRLLIASMYENMYGPQPSKIIRFMSCHNRYKLCWHLDEDSEKHELLILYVDSVKRNDILIRHYDMFFDMSQELYTYFKMSE